jgi:hypothetical protein
MASPRLGHKTKQKFFPCWELITGFQPVKAYFVYTALSYFTNTVVLNPLNAELNPICHLLILLGDLTFMGPCI